MVSDEFRHQLRHETKLWQAEGLINSELYQQISERYQLDSLETSARNRFIAIVIGLGGILLGLAVITFVAANWQDWSREVKVTLLLSLFIGVNAAGFYLWRTPPTSLAKRKRGGGKQRLGEALLLLGAIILGANMALMAQMFHIGGSPYGLFLAWGLGVLAMAYSLRLTSLGVLAILLIGSGYGLSVFDWSAKESSWLLLVQHMPVVVSLLFVPLAYWCRSRAIFALAAILVIFSLEASLAQGSSGASALIVALMCAMPPALLWGYDDTLWPNIDSKLFQPLARNLALLCLAILFYVLAFQWPWQSSPGQPIDAQTLMGWSSLLDVALLGALIVWEWLRLGRQGRKHPSRRGVDLTTNVIACFIAISALIPLWHNSFSPISVLATFLFNVLLFLLAAGLIREGLALGNRGTFWGGITLLALQIISRLLEYNTGLLFKAFVFFLCGIGVIAAGLWFERYSSALMPSKENSR
ncbi:MAG: DUF2157 domain-containing protein [Microcoleus vaginatus WJT46-NPBG5]|jgi:uncharacterized membrane protein|nr:DUF2157 domain-containing protein [Microcoleus vaginatus WJT46-NPBG5]